jgi:hypothetical protein
MIVVRCPPGRTFFNGAADVLPIKRIYFVKRDDPDALSAPKPTANSCLVVEVAKASVSRESPTVVRFLSVIAEGLPP